MHLGVTTRNASWTGVSDLEWERLLVELSQRTGIPIERHTHGAQSRELSPVRNPGSIVTGSGGGSNPR